MAEHKLKPLFTWRSVVADKESALTSTERLVALTLSLHMSERGDSCFPSMATLAEETALDERTVRRLMRSIADKGYVTVKLGGGQGRPNRYRATIPPLSTALGEGGHTTPVSRDEGATKGGTEADTGALSASKGGTRPPEDVLQDVKEDVLRNGGDVSQPEPKTNGEGRAKFREVKERLAAELGRAVDSEAS